MQSCYCFQKCEPKDKDYRRVIRKMYYQSSVCHHGTQVLESQKNSGNESLMIKVYFTFEIGTKMELMN